MIQSGVYAITNRESGKAYVGSTTDFKKRWRHHRNDLRRGIHHNECLQRAWGKYGPGAFKWEICEYVDDPEHLHIREQYWLDFHRMLNEVYNFGPAARHAMLGRRHTEEHRRKLSEANKGRVPWMKGRKHTTAARRKISEANKARAPASEETRRRISESLARPYPAFIHRITGEIIPAGVNLRALCRERGLSQGDMASVARGAQLHYKGWVLLSEHLQPWLL